MAGKVAVYHGKFLHVRNLDQVEAILAKLPDRVKEPLRRAAELSADDMVERLKQTTPVAPEFERHPGELRDSVHRAPGQTEIGAQVVVDAKDPEGRFYAAHVEYGHRTAEGAHVPAKPFFWPTYQTLRRRMVSRIAAAARRVIKAESAA